MTVKGDKYYVYKNFSVKNMSSNLYDIKEKLISKGKTELKEMYIEGISTKGEHYCPGEGNNN